MTPEEQFPLRKIMLGNSFLISAVYLGLGLLTSLLSRFWPGDPPESVVRVLAALDRLPAGALAILGLLQPLRDAYEQQAVTGLQLRLVFGATTVAVIFTLGLFVGFGMWATLVARERWRAKRA